MNEFLEEGTEARLDFQKLKKVADSEAAVIPVAVQEADTLEMLLIAYMDEQALTKTRETGELHLYSTSRRELWHKGASSGDTLKVSGIYVNCEQNSLLVKVKRHAGVCHTRDASGATRKTCYYRALKDGDVLEFL